MSATVAQRVRNRTQSLDVGRGISAMLVVLFHGLLVFRVNGADNPHLLPLDLENPGWCCNICCWRWPTGQPM
ncbi:hypothetical protein ACFQU7_34115 [Pseudoroseomonas wenyumeiae]